LRADELPIAPDNTFSMVVIPDTQHYKGIDTKGNPDSKDPLTNKVFSGWTNWIAANLDRQRIAFVSHVGGSCSSFLDSAEATVNRLGLPKEAALGVGDSFLIGLHDPVHDRKIEHKFRAVPLGDDFGYRRRV
jgi:hypothetical protein